MNVHAFIIFQVKRSHMNIQGIKYLIQHSWYLKILSNGTQLKVHTSINP